jgi:hypothetical protein
MCQPAAAAQALETMRIARIRVARRGMPPAIAAEPSGAIFAAAAAVAAGAAVGRNCRTRQVWPGKSFPAAPPGRIDSAIFAGI